MLLYELLHKIWLVKEQIFVQTAPFSISHCILDAKFCQTFGLVNFLPDGNKFLQVRSYGASERLMHLYLPKPTQNTVFSHTTESII